MPDSSLDRLRRYVRVAYDVGAGEGTQLAEPGPAPRRRRWAISGALAVPAAAIVLGVGLLAGAWLLLSPGEADPPVPLPAPVSSAPAEAAGGARTDLAAAAAESQVQHVVVHVAGAVDEPGIVEVPGGTRVDGAITAAGGARADADLDLLNLAAVVEDGQQIYVPVEGEQPPMTIGQPGAVQAGGTGGLVDLNTADSTALQALPGVGPAIADRIIAWRTENGAFASVEALLQVSGIGPATMERLRDLVTV